jgi:hypothetical protein
MKTYIVEYFNADQQFRTMIVETDSEPKIPFIAKKRDKRFDHVRTITEKVTTSLTLQSN